MTHSFIYPKEPSDIIQRAHDFVASKRGKNAANALVLDMAADIEHLRKGISKERMLPHDRFGISIGFNNGFMLSGLEDSVNELVRILDENERLRYELAQATEKPDD